METKDLFLRTWQESDADSLFELWQDIEMKKTEFRILIRKRKVWN